MIQTIRGLLGGAAAIFMSISYFVLPGNQSMELIAFISMALAMVPILICRLEPEKDSESWQFFARDIALFIALFFTILWAVIHLA